METRIVFNGMLYSKIDYLAYSSNGLRPALEYILVTPDADFYVTNGQILYKGVCEIIGSIDSNIYIHKSAFEYFRRMKFNKKQDIIIDVVDDNTLMAYSLKLPVNENTYPPISILEHFFDVDDPYTTPSKGIKLDIKTLINYFKAFSHSDIFEFVVPDNNKCIVLTAYDGDKCVLHNGHVN